MPYNDTQCFLTFFYDFFSRLNLCVRMCMCASSATIFEHGSLKHRKISIVSVNGSFFWGNDFFSLFQRFSGVIKPFEDKLMENKSHLMCQNFISKIAMNLCLKESIIINRNRYDKSQCHILFFYIMLSIYTMIDVRFYDYSTFFKEHYD